MTDEILLQELEALSKKLDIVIIRVDLEGRSGGLCVIKGERRFILDRRLDSKAQVEVLSKAFSKLPLDNVYLKPAVRDAIDNQDEPWV
ncbi:MAG: hypothetical protein VX910_09895 [Candidatus Latescibacterota bacterium]|nr:hypothetical protein [Candidatus Latescibacterota bacterium]